MREEAATITAAHLNRRLAVPDGSDEIPRLAETLNEMLDRIDATSRLQRQFVSDASHELRSPLATLRQLAEVARDYPERTAQDSLARDVLAEEARMEELVSALLILARIDDGVPATAGPVDLDDLVLAQARRLRRDDGPRFDVSGVSAGQVVGDSVLLGQVVGNLLSNALRHAREEVSVSLQEYDGEVVLTVDDDGNGIPEHDRAACLRALRATRRGTGARRRWLRPRPGHRPQGRRGPRRHRPRAGVGERGSPLRRGRPHRLSSAQPAYVAVVGQR